VVVQVVFFSLCLAICGYGGWLFVNGIRSRSWPSVPGRITTSRLKTLSSSGSGRSTFSKVLVLEYSYDVNGQPYTGSRIAMLPKGWFAAGRPAELHARYPAGTEHPVYYDPAKPARCTLTQGIAAGSWSFYAIVGMFAFFLVMRLITFLSR
jgi:hypothetical protein